MILFHGSTICIEHPLCDFGRPNLDFGKGFYLTDRQIQAEEWARRQASAKNATPLLNLYEFDKDASVKDFRYLAFPSYDRAWLHFIVDNRNGKMVWKDYDVVEGGIANDRVIDTVNLYSIGLMDEETALSRLSEHAPNNQICILNQAVVEKYLLFKESIEL